MYFKFLITNFLDQIGFNFKKRVNRKQFWSFNLMVLILTVAGMAMGFSFDKSFLFLKFLSVLLAIIQLPVWINRFHDVDLPATAFLAPGVIY